MNLFEVDDYKKIVKFLIQVKRKKTRGALKQISQHLGVHATLISQILSGPKDFTEEQTLAVCDFLKVPKLESQYLLILVQIERAGSMRLKKHYKEIKTQIQRQSRHVANRLEKTNPISEKEKAIYYSSWTYSAVLLLCTMENGVDLDFICRRFQLVPSKAREILRFLESIELVKEKNGRFSAGIFSIHLEEGSPFISKHHANWRIKALEASEDITEEEFMYSANFSISREDFKKLRAEFLSLTQKFVEFAKNSPAEDVAQFNLDLFWLRK